MGENKGGVSCPVNTRSSYISGKTKKLELPQVLYGLNTLFPSFWKKIARMGNQLQKNIDTNNDLFLIEKKKGQLLQEVTIHVLVQSLIVEPRYTLHFKQGKATLCIAQIFGIGKHTR